MSAHSNPEHEVQMTGPHAGPPWYTHSFYIILALLHNYPLAYE